ncbi:MAG: hypothetical protein J7555_03510 [Chloroflexi bacterium]|jgi:hypothetical protein|nr:hypothetical protein [Chloroflexota bacterium]
MRALIGFPILFLTAILQSALFSRLSLLHGHADLMLIVLAIWATHPRVLHAWEWTLLGALLTAFLSAFPWALIFLTYLVPTALARTLRSVLRSHLLNALLVISAGTGWMGIMGWLYLFTVQASASPLLIAGEILSPGLLMNLLLTLPTFVILRRIIDWTYPGEEHE